MKVPLALLLFFASCADTVVRNTSVPPESPSSLAPPAALPPGAPVDVVPWIPERPAPLETSPASRQLRAQIEGTTLLLFASNVRTSGCDEGYSSRVFRRSRSLHILMYKLEAGRPPQDRMCTAIYEEFESEIPVLDLKAGTYKVYLFYHDARLRPEDLTSSLTDSLSPVATLSVNLPGEAHPEI